MRELAIKVENLGKKYEINKSSDTLTGSFKNLFATREKESFWALDDVSFEIKEGESIGIIGRNGAGKSTLLKILSKITPPTRGKATIKGKVSSLLEVGTGFHPELTGRENIFLNGALLGMSRPEIKSNFEEIIDFSGIERFIDTPVKKYSSGMYVRLAFSVAAHLDSDVLFIDEVLAVGDFEFQQKCLGKMNELGDQQSKTVLFVSHNLQNLSSLCKKTMHFDRGRLFKFDSTEIVLGIYNSVEKNSHLPFDIIVENHDDYCCLFLQNLDRYVDSLFAVNIYNSFNVKMAYSESLISSIEIRIKIKFSVWQNGIYNIYIASKNKSKDIIENFGLVYSFIVKNKSETLFPYPLLSLGVTQNQIQWIN